MTDLPTEASHASQDRTAAAVGIALLVLLAATVVLAQVDLGGWNTLASAAIAGAKTWLVLWYFMELRHSDRATWVAAAYGFVLLGVLFWLTFADYLDREL